MLTMLSSGSSTAERCAGAARERGQPTQIDVFFEVVREDRIRGAIGVEVKLSESEFGGCRGWNGVGGTGPINPDRKRCLNARRVVESPETQCFMAECEADATGT